MCDLGVKLLFILVVGLFGTCIIQSLLIIFGHDIVASFRNSMVVFSKYMEVICDHGVEAGSREHICLAVLRTSIELNKESDECLASSLFPVVAAGSGKAVRSTSWEHLLNSFGKASTRFWSVSVGICAQSATEDL